MTQLNRIQLTSQTPNHVKRTKILSTGQRLELLTASAYLDMLRPRKIKFTVTKYGFRHVYKLPTCLVLLVKVSLYNKTPFLMVSKIYLGMQFSNKFLMISSTNGSLENAPRSKSILIIV